MQLKVPAIAILIVLEKSDTTPNVMLDIITKKSRKLKKCKPRPKKKPKCVTSKYGCCPDNKTVATGPFDEGNI